MQDMAKLIGDNAMAEVAGMCTCRNVAERPASIPRLRNEGKGGRKRSVWLAVIIFFAIVLVVVISAFLIAAARGSDVNPDGNSVMDMSAWVGNIG